MTGLDERLEEIGAAGGLWLALVVALLIGLRHATDPDHLTALSTLVLGDRGDHGAARLGLAWGAGHGVTVVVIGLPVVLWGDALPGWAQTTAELLVAAVIVALAVRLLVRWRRGYFHAHAHEHDGVSHVHPHVHEGAHGPHEHRHELGRTSRAAFGIGLLHGAGGSAGVGILLVAAIDPGPEAVAALLLFAAGSALSMALCSAGWGRLLAGAAVERRLSLLAPAFGTASLTFGCWYGLGALG
jgi:hypothetical protein